MLQQKIAMIERLISHSHFGNTLVRIEWCRTTVQNDAWRTLEFKMGFGKRKFSYKVLHTNHIRKDQMLSWIIIGFITD